MKWFKLGWLTSKERKKLVKEVAKEIANSTQSDIQAPVYEGPTKNIIYSPTSKNLTVIFYDGSVITKSGVEKEFFDKVRNAQSQAAIEDMLIEKIAQVVVEQSVIETKEERQLVSDNLDILRENVNFIVNGSKVYLKGVNLEMPASVIASFIEILEKLEIEWSNEDSDEKYDELNEQFLALKMFWLKLALNTLPQSREDLLVFVKKNDVRITKNGNLVLYRRIVSKANSDTRLVTFISQEYYRLKKEGYGTTHFAIYLENGNYKILDLNEFNPKDPQGISPLGNLEQLYRELPTDTSNTFTAYHDNKVTIKIGGIYSIPQSGINLNNGLCAAGGLHAAAVDYNYSGFGDIPVVVLVNPSKAITVPRGETGKLRTTEMFVACVNDKPLGQHFDEGALAAFDSEYHDLTLGELENAAKDKSFAALSVLENVPAVSLVDLNSIKEMLKNRIKEVVW